MRIHPAIWISSGLVVAGISLNLAGSFWIFTLVGIMFIFWGVFQIIMSYRHPVKMIHQNMHAHKTHPAHLQQEKYAPVICPACHGPLHSRYNFCPRCGKKVR